MSTDVESHYEPPKSQSDDLPGHVFRFEEDGLLVTASVDALSGRSVMCFGREIVSTHTTLAGVPALHSAVSDGAKYSVYFEKNDGFVHKLSCTLFKDNVAAQSQQLVLSSRSSLLVGAVVGFLIAIAWGYIGLTSRLALLLLPSIALLLVASVLHQRRLKRRPPVSVPLPTVLPDGLVEEAEDSPPDQAGSGTNS